MEFGYLISKFGGKRKVDALTENTGLRSYLSLLKVKIS